MISDDQFLEGLLALDRGLHAKDEAIFRAALDRFHKVYQGTPSSGRATVLLKLIDRFVHFSAAEYRQRSAILATLGACDLGEAVDGAGEVAHRLTPVWESSDLLARCLVVEAYGILAVSLCDTTAVHYRLVESLQSPHRMERMASLRACEKYLFSPKFTHHFVPVALELYPKLSVSSTERPELLRLLQAAKDDVELAKETYDAAMEWLEMEELPESLARAILDLLHTLSMHCLPLVKPFAVLLARIPPSLLPLQGRFIYPLV